MCNGYTDNYQRQNKVVKFTQPMEVTAKACHKQHVPVEYRPIFQDTLMRNNYALYIGYIKNQVLHMPSYKYCFVVDLIIFRIVVTTGLFKNILIRRQKNVRNRT